MAVEAKTLITSERTLPWQSIVTEFPEGSTFRDAIGQVGLDYQVGYSDLVLGVNGNTVKGKRATYRTDTGAALGVVGDKYIIKQNRDAFAFLESIVDGGSLVPVSAGAFRGGARPFIQSRLPDNITVAGDEYVPFIFCANSHDGGLKFTIALSGIRVVCQNTYAANVKAPRRFTVKHLASMDGRIEDARRVLNISVNYFAQFKQALERLADAPISLEAFKEQVVDKMFPMPLGQPTDQQREFVAKKRSQLLTLYMQSPTVPRGTKYGALQAVTEWADHVKNGQKGEPETRVAQKADWILLGDGIEFKDKAALLIESVR